MEEEVIQPEVVEPEAEPSVESEVPEVPVEEEVAA